MSSPAPRLAIDARPRGPQGPLAQERLLGRPVLGHLLEQALLIGPPDEYIAVYAREEEHALLYNLVSEKLSRWVLRAEPADLAEEYISKNNLKVETQKEGERLFIFTNEPENLQRELIGKLKLRETVIREASLEDLFLKLTGREIQEA